MDPEWLQFPVGTKLPGGASVAGSGYVDIGNGGLRLADQYAQSQPQVVQDKDSQSSYGPKQKKTKSSYGPINPVSLQSQSIGDNWGQGT